MEPPRKRKLVYGAGQQWKGWFCACCSWNRPLPETLKEREELARQIQQLFEEHSCEAFGAKVWKTNA